MSTTQERDSQNKPSEWAEYEKGRLNVVKTFWIWALLSILLIIPGVVIMGMSMSSYPTHSPLRLGIDFTGGTMLQYGFAKKLDQSDVGNIRQLLDQAGLQGSVIQLQEAEAGMQGVSGQVTTEQPKEEATPSEQSPAEQPPAANQAAPATAATGTNAASTNPTAAATSTPQTANTPAALPTQAAGESAKPGAEAAQTTTPADATKQQAESKQSITELFADSQKAADQAAQKKAFDIQSILSIRTKDLTTDQTIQVQKLLHDHYGEYILLQKSRVGPVLAKELFVKASWALILAYALIVMYLTYRFQLDYALVAMVTLAHDTLFMLGAFSIMGWFFNVEVDSLFVTAILTVVGFSVHDTIVVFDRIRENMKILYTKKVPFDTVVNYSINQTIARSINTSMTAMIVLAAMYFFGGESIKHFVLAMLMGIAVGTYSSIFVASPMLAWWRARRKKASGATSQPQTA